MCRSKHKNQVPRKAENKQPQTNVQQSKEDVHRLEVSDGDLSSSSGDDEHLHNILQLGDKSCKFLMHDHKN